MLLRVEESQETGCYTILIQNINEQKQTEFALREQLEQAEEENKAKTEFLSRMSHEIRTPMNGILGMLELAKMDIDQKDKVEDYLDKVNSLSQFLLSLINDILDLSRIESGKTELLCEPFDLFAMAEKLRLINMAKAEHRTELENEVEQLEQCKSQLCEMKQWMEEQLA